VGSWEILTSLSRHWSSCWRSRRRLEEMKLMMLLNLSQILQSICQIS